MRHILMITFTTLLLLGCKGQTQQLNGANVSEKRTYMVITAILNDRDAFLTGYAKATGPLVEKFGGRYVMMGPGAKLLEGEWGDGASVVISEWPDHASVDAFWNSTEYREAKKLREGVADVQVLVIDAPKFTRD